MITDCSYFTFWILAVVVVSFVSYKQVNFEYFIAQKAFSNKLTANKKVGFNSSMMGNSLTVIVIISTNSYWTLVFVKVQSF